MNVSTRDRAVSDVLAFAITVGLILASATTAYVVGVGELTDVQEYEREQKVVHAIELADDAFDAVYRGDAPRRTTELDVEGASLTVEPSSVGVNVGFEGGGWNNTTHTTNALSLSVDDTTASTESGLVARRVGGLALDRRAPSFVCGGTTTLTVVELRGSWSYGGGSVVVEATRDDRASEFASWSNASRVVVDVSGSVNRGAWERALEANGWQAMPSADGQYGCSASTVHVRTVVVDLRATS